MRRNLQEYVIFMLLFVIACILKSVSISAQEANYYGDDDFKTQIGLELSADRENGANVGNIQNIGGKKTYFVSTTGKDSNPGTMDKPFRTISYATSQLEKGDTLYIREGSYKESIYLDKTCKGDKNSYINISSYKEEQVTISGEGRDGANLLSIEGSAYVRINGISFAYATGHNAFGIQVGAGSNHIILSRNVLHDIKVNDPTVQDSCANGILLFGDSKKSINNVLIYQNTIKNCVTGWAESLTACGNCRNINVIKNTISNTGNIGIDIAGNYGYCPKASLDYPRYCLVFDNEVSKCVSPNATSYGIYVDGGQHVDIIGNRVSECSGGIEVGAEQVPVKSSYSTSYVNIFNNTITNNVECAISIGGYEKNLGWVKNVTVSGNCCRNNGLDTAIIVLAKCNTVKFSNNIFQNDSGEGDLVYYALAKKYRKNISEIS